MQLNITPMIQSNISLNIDTLAEKAKPVFEFPKANHLNVYTTMPCPLKIPFQQIFSAFIERWNGNSNNVPINWPAINTCEPVDIEDPIRQATSIDQVPDILVTTNYDILFRRSFHEKFMATGLMTGINENLYPQNYPPSLIAVGKQYGLGFLGFSSWGLVFDSSVLNQSPMPAQWFDLKDPQFKDLLSIHGCHGKAGSLLLLLYFKKKGGTEAIKQLADNIVRVRHFSELIKAMNSSNPSRTPFVIMPDVAIANIPSIKHANLLMLKSAMLAPMMLVVKESKKEACKGIIEFFMSQEFKQLLTGNAYLQPEHVPHIEHHQFEALELLSQEYYESVSGKLEKQFVQFLGDKLVS